MRSSELQNQRLREVFKVKSQEYREAIYILFGYKVDGLPNKVYRLSSVYAEGPEEYLIFQVCNRKLFHKGIKERETNLTFAFSCPMGGLPNHNSYMQCASSQMLQKVRCPYQNRMICHCFVFYFID